jgi:hypothetical protein
VLTPRNIAASLTVTYSLRFLSLTGFSMAVKLGHVTFRTLRDGMTRGHLASAAEFVVRLRLSKDKREDAKPLSIQSEYDGSSIYL